MNPMIEARRAEADETERSYRELTSDEADLDIKSAGDFNLVEHVGNEGGSGLWEPELRATIDLQTLKGLLFNEDWVFILVDRIASKIAAQRLRVMRWIVQDGKGRGVPAENHPVQKTLERPNQYQDYHQFMYSVVADMTMCGNAVIWNARTTRRLIPVPIEMVRIDFDRMGALMSYGVYQWAREDTPLLSRMMTLSPDEVVHFRRPNPSSMLWGLSPFIPGRKSVLFNRYSSEYLNNFYIKGAQPGLALELGEGANEKSALRLLRSLEVAHTGRRNQRRNMILPRGVTAKEITQKLADQDLIEYVKSNRETFINLVQVPKHELSLQEAGSLGSEEQRVALRSFWGGPLRAAMRLVEGSLNDAFATELGADYYLEFDISDVEALRDDEEAKGRVAEGMLKTHTINEVRAKLYEMPPLSGGDELPGKVQPPAFPFGGGGAPPPPQPQQQQLAAAAPAPQPVALEARQLESVMSLVQDVASGKMPRASALALLRVGFGMPEHDALAILANAGEDGPAAAPVAAEEMGAPEQAAVLAAPDAKEIRSRNMDRLAPLIKGAGGWWKRREETISQAASSATEKTRRRALKMLAAQGEAIAKAVRAHLGGKAAVASLRLKAKGKVPSKSVLERRIRAALDEQKSKWEEGQTDDLAATVELAYDAQLMLPFNLPNEDALAAIRARDENGRRSMLSTRSLTTFANVSKTTTDRAMGAVEDGLANGKTIDEIAKAIEEQTSGKLADDRALLIARNEALTAVSLGQAAAMSNAAEVVPKLKKAWLNAGDDRVRGNPGGLYPDSEADHWSLQGEVRDHDAAFSNGLQFPRDPSGGTGEVINCRCTWVMVPGDDADQIGLENLDSEAWGGTER